jgi:hypothetical protein
MYVKRFARAGRSGAILFPRKRLITSMRTSDVPKKLRRRLPGMKVPSPGGWT